MHDRARTIWGKTPIAQQVAELKRQVLAKQRLIKAYETDRSKLTVKGSEEWVKRLAELTAEVAPFR